MILAPVLAFLLVAQDGMTAYREGRYEDAARLLDEEMARVPDYDGLVALGLAQGRLGRLDEAERVLDRAIVLDPTRPEAWVERGGLRFLQKRYQEAVRDLERGLERKEDAYARDLLASSLHLAGRPEEALARWNAIGQPTLGRASITGITHTHDRVVRRELAFAEGETLDLGALRKSRLRLQELGIFDRITLRPLPQGEGRADLEIALAERHGFGRPFELALTTGANALFERAAFRYVNLMGQGVNLGAEYRWEEARPRVAVGGSWPRPFGLPAVLHLGAFRGRQQYALEGVPQERRFRGADLDVRSVLGPRTVGHVALRVRDRAFAEGAPEEAAPDVSGLEAGVELRVLDRRRHRLEASARGFRSGEFLGGDVVFPRVVVRLGYRAFPLAPEGVAVEPAVIAAQAFLGWAGDHTPLDDMFAPGASPDMELPLRAHPQARDGVLGETAIGRSLLLGNLEFRKRLFGRGGFGLGAVAFYDAARVARTVAGSDQTFHDVGAGLRLALPGAAVIRVDFGHGLTDGRNVVTAGLGQVF